jgi:hypothetical protein
LSNTISSVIAKQAQVKLVVPVPVIEDRLKRTLTGQVVFRTGDDPRVQGNWRNCPDLHW